MAHKRHYFKVDMREPYQGNTLPIKIEIHVYEKGTVEVVVVNPEGMKQVAHKISYQMFIE